MTASIEDPDKEMAIQDLMKYANVRGRRDFVMEPKETVSYCGKLYKYVVTDTNNPIGLQRYKHHGQPTYKYKLMPGYVIHVNYVAYFCTEQTQEIIQLQQIYDWMTEESYEEQPNSKSN